MKMKINKKFSKFIVFLCTVLLFTLAFSFNNKAYGADVQPPASSTPVQMEVIAKTSIKNLIVNFDKNTRKIKVDFDLIDTLKNQIGVNYSLSLSDSANTEKTFIYNEDVYLNVNTFVHKSIEEIVPDYLSGKLNVFVKAQNSSGVLLAVGFLLQGIDVPKAKTSVAMRSCYLTIDSINTKDKNTKYTLLQGVDLGTGENLFINCKVSNTSNKSLNLIPKFDSYERSISGKMVNSQKNDAISIAQGASLIKVNVPLVDTPQAYDSSFSLSDISSSLISNNVVLHYVVRGDSGTVNMINTDKTSYDKGETAKIDIIWSPRADRFPDSRFDWKNSTTSASQKLMGALSITDLSGVACIDPISFTPPASQAQTINLNAIMKKDCNGFTTKIDVKAQDANGAITSLVNNNYKIPSEVSSKQNSVYIIVFTIAFILISIFLIILMNNRKKAGVKVLALFVPILIAGCLSMANTARADSFTVRNPLDSVESRTAYVNLDAPTNAIAGNAVPINISESASWQACGNQARADTSYTLSIKDSHNIIEYDYDSTIINSSSDSLNQTVNYVGGGAYDPHFTNYDTHTVYFSPGTYTITAVFKMKFGYGIGSYTMIATTTVPSVATTDADIGLKVNQGTTAIPDIVNIAVEKNNGSTSRLRIAKEGVVHGIQLVDANDPLATKVIINSPSTGLKALKKYSSSGSVNQPFGYWTFDESSGSAVADSSGNNLTGTTYNAGVVTALPRSAGVSGNAINFNGNYQYVVIPMSKNFVGGSITVSAWVKSLNYNGAMFIVSRGNVNGEWNLFFEGGLLKWRGASNSTYNYNFAQCTPPTTGEWHNIVATQINGTPNVATLYIDGNVCGTSNSVPPIMNNVGNIQIGAYDDIISTVGAHTYNYFFEGQMDNIRLYNEAKTAEEVREIYMAR